MKRNNVLSSVNLCQNEGTTSSPCNRTRPTSMLMSSRGYKVRMFPREIKHRHPPSAINYYLLHSSVFKMQFSFTTVQALALLYSTVASAASLQQYTNWGANPGNLPRVDIYVPDRLAPNPPVILGVSSIPEARNAYAESGRSCIRVEVQAPSSMVRTGSHSRPTSSDSFSSTPLPNRKSLLTIHRISLSHAFLGRVA